MNQIYSYKFRLLPNSKQIILLTQHGVSLSNKQLVGQETSTFLELYVVH